MFYISNLDTGTYTFKADLDSKESSNPLSLTGAVTSGCNLFVGTFTVVGMLGTISGKVTASGVPIATGVLLMATTTTIASDPPVISSATLAGCSYYASSSLEDGTYSFDVRGSTSTNYNIYAWYPAKSTGGAITYSRQSILNVQVLPGLTTSDENLSW